MTVSDLTLAQAQLSILVTQFAELMLGPTFEPTPIQFKLISGSSLLFQLTDLDALLVALLYARLDTHAWMQSWKQIWMHAWMYG